MSEEKRATARQRRVTAGQSRVQHSGRVGGGDRMVGEAPLRWLLSGVHCLQPRSVLPTPPLPDASDPRTASPCSVLPLGEKRATVEKEVGHCTFGENDCRAMRGVLLRRACRCPFPPVLALTPHPQASVVVRGHTVRARYWYTTAEATTGRGGQVTAGGGALPCIARGSGSGLQGSPPQPAQYRSPLPGAYKVQT